MGIEPGMPCAEAAQRMLEVRPAFRGPAPRQVLVHESALGRVYALDTVKYADARIAGSVLCMGSHSASSMPKYLDALGIRLAGVITNDVGRAKDDSGIAGLETLDGAGVAAAVVSCETARVGDAQSTYQTGVVSACNRTARALGVEPGRSAVEAAAHMLAAFRR